MRDDISRRTAIQSMIAGSALLGTNGKHSLQAKDADYLAMLTVGYWNKKNDRVWLGEEFWANPMEDWRLVEGTAECQSGGGNRSVHLLTHQLTDVEKPFGMSVTINQVDAGKKDGGAGFRIGVRSDLNEYRSNCFASGGIIAGLVNGQLVLGRKREKLEKEIDPANITLGVSGQPAGNQYELILSAYLNGMPCGSISHRFRPEAILGNVAITNNFSASGNRGGGGSRYRFSDWNVGGEAFSVDESQKFGPILWAMYSLSDSRSDEGFVLKLSGLTGPLGKEDNRKLELQIEKEGEWNSLGDAELNTDSWTATFRIPNWDETRETPYRLIYREHHRDGSKTESTWSGTIKANPTGRPLRIGALTCQNDYAFPYEPVADNLVKLDPDLLYFSGDQLYENHGGFGVIRDDAEMAILNYLRKFYQFGWSFREAMRNAPTLCIPDDHDVFQGNIWGEGGAAMEDLDAGTSSKGGYRQPVRMVNVVHQTCAGHHPDYYDPTPAKRNMSVYYGDMVYGNVGFAIIADRQWKSGPEHVDAGDGRADHVRDPDFDTSKLDKEGLVLLGERQEKFLKDWADDWRGHSMKVVLSQTVFAGVATHHGQYDGYLKADLDSGGWPQTPRDRAVDILRASMALHINGDQHLTTLTQYGVQESRDSNWSFCTPAIAVGYPRWWRPDEIGMEYKNRPEHNLPNTGEYIDGLGNHAYVYAVGNPEVASEKHRYDRAHQKGSGFGLVTIDTDKKTYHLEAFRFLVDATDGKETNQFPGWPVTIHQQENRGENRLQ